MWANFQSANTRSVICVGLEWSQPHAPASDYSSGKTLGYSEPLETSGEIHTIIWEHSSPREEGRGHAVLRPPLESVAYSTFRKHEK